MIGFIGLSHLGTCSSVAAAERGFEVIGFDARTDLVTGMNKGEFPIFEPKLLETYRAHRARLKFTANASDLSACELVYFSFDVPTDASNRSDLAAVEAMLDEYSKVLTP